MLPLPTTWTYETGFPLETGIPGFWDSTVPVSHRTRGGAVHSTTPQWGSEGPVSVARCYTSTFGSTDGQSMGRGQVQSPQARMSRTQGRVYAVGPEAEHADQPDM